MQRILTLIGMGLAALSLSSIALAQALRFRDFLPAFSAQTYSVRLAGGEDYAIVVDGERDDSAFRVRVFAPSRDGWVLWRQDAERDDDLEMEFRAPVRGEYLIEVRNISNVGSRYVVRIADD